MSRRFPPPIPTLHVSVIELPREFEQLYELAYNLWWTWTPKARELFSAIDSAKWGRYHNPVELLINVDPKRWYRLVENEAFHTAYREVIDELEAYLRAGDAWFERAHGAAREERIAYFSMEYGLHQSLAIYSGGLGVLSGDHCKAASDLGLPFVAVGLLYRYGYFQQDLDHEGMQQHIYPEYDFTRLPLRPVASATGREVFVSLRLPGRDVKIKLWLAQVGRVPLILLDTDVPENHPCDRPITNLLYVGGREMRLLQEMVLGIGGVRALRAVGIEPTVWHLNEGHSVFLQLERLRELVDAEKLDAYRARDRLRRDAIFTTHTPVPAGNEQFDDPLIRKYFAGWCERVGLSVDELLAWGRRGEGGDANFNLTALAIRTASWVNGVSKLNARVASDMWRHLFAGEEQPIRAITNGVHARTWLGPELQSFLRQAVSPGWEEKLLEPDGWESLRAVPDAELWARHRAQKERLGRFLRSRLRDQFARHGAAPDDLRAIDAVFDPETLTIGFARRFATYKRASLVFSDLERLRAILNRDQRPVQMLFAGKAHPADRPGQALIQHIFDLSRSDGFAGKVIFLENYDMRMGRMLVQGVDVWLNTPRRPLEASGTSGQKVAMNGGLNFSILDGWWPEGWNGDNGWVIGGEEPSGDEGRQDWEDAQSLYATLEEQIVPLFYDRGDDGLPHGWIERMKTSMVTLTAQFSASRMVRDYVEQGYLPAADRGRE